MYQEWQVINQVIQLLTVVESNVTFAQKSLNLFPNHCLVHLKMEDSELMVIRSRNLSLSCSPEI